MTSKTTVVSAVCSGVLSLTSLTSAHAFDGYWSSGAGEAVMSGAGECVRTGTWEKTDATEQCDPDLLPKPEPVVEPEPPPPPAPIPVIETITLSADANFAFDKDEPLPGSRENVRRVADQIQALDTLDQITVTGHTDSIGTETYNQDLSERRAASIKRLLVENGIDDNLITTRGLGESNPVTSNETKAGRAQNRRVEVEIRGAKRTLEQAPTEPESTEPESDTLTP